VNGQAPAKGWFQTSFVFQSPRLLPWKTTLENADFGLEMRYPGMPRNVRLDRARAELRKVGLGGDFDKMPTMLSGGEKQRVAIARALAMEPEIILMDGPFSALDHASRSRLRQQILDLWAERKKTILFVTRDIDEALFLADRIVVLTHKPTQVAKVITVTEPRPRDLGKSDELAQRRDQLVTLLEEPQIA